jgi:hypothetical protein
MEVWLLVILVVATCLMRYFHDLRRYCQRRASTWEPVIRKVIERNAGERIARSDLKVLSTIMRQAPVPRLTPTLFAFSMVAIVTVTVAVSLAPGAGRAIDLRTSVMTSLLATMATIAGFYFGGKAAEPAPALR